MAIDIVIPVLGESVSEATLVKWHKSDGEAVQADEPLCELETDKANVDVPAPGAGVVKRKIEEGQTVRIGDLIGTIDPDGQAFASEKPAAGVRPARGEASPAKSPAASAASATSVASAASDAVAGGLPKRDVSIPPEDLSPAVRRVVAESGIDPADVQGTGRGGRVTKQDAEAHAQAHAASLHADTPAGNGKTADAGQQTASAAKRTSMPASEQARNEQAAPASGRTPESGPADNARADTSVGGVRRVPMSKIRKRIAANLLQAQQTAAILTTFNEIDLSAVMAMRTKHKEAFEKRHGVGLGFMSFFARAAVLSLQQFERVNASLDGDDLVYHDYVNLGVAVSTERGLTVPVLKNVQEMSFANIESEIKRVAVAARDGKLKIDELSGGTFTITNGGVFGSLLSTPILNPPQSGILGMHAIQQRPVAVDGKVEIRPMMYVALSYDHRVIDGQESVRFLVRLKELLEDPARLLLGV